LEVVNNHKVTHLPATNSSITANIRYVFSIDSIFKILIILKHLSQKPRTVRGNANTN